MDSDLVPNHGGKTSIRSSVIHPPWQKEYEMHRHLERKSRFGIRIKGWKTSRKKVQNDIFPATNTLRPRQIRFPDYSVGFGVVEMVMSMLI